MLIQIGGQIPVYSLKNLILKNCYFRIQGLTFCVEIKMNNRKNFLSVRHISYGLSVALERVLLIYFGYS